MIFGCLGRCKRSSSNVSSTFVTAFPDFAQNWLSLLENFVDFWVGSSKAGNEIINRFSSIFLGNQLLPVINVQVLSLRRHWGTKLQKSISEAKLIMESKTSKISRFLFKRSFIDFLNFPLFRGYFESWDRKIFPLFGVFHYLEVSTK